MWRLVLDIKTHPVNQSLPDTRAKCRVTVVGAVVNFWLGAAKVTVGTLAQSQALIADGVHSLSDLFSDAVVLLAATYGGKAADRDHPYGHGRIETVATAFVGAVLLVIAAGFAYDVSIRLFFAPETILVPSWMALVAAFLSIVIKESLFRYTRAIGRRVRSNMITANAWHHRSDSLSSIVVVVGIAGVLLGFPWLDAVAAIIVAFMLAYMGGKFIWRAFRELVDTALTPEESAEIMDLINGIDGVRSVHGLRSRRMAEDALIDIHIVVNPRLSVSEGHRIAEEVRAGLISEIDDVAEVMVHVEHEDPLWHDKTLGIPLRTRVEEDLRQCWFGLPLGKQVNRLDLHYIEGELEVEVHLRWKPTDAAPMRPKDIATLVAAAESLGYIKTCRVHLVAVDPVEWLGNTKR